MKGSWFEYKKVTKMSQIKSKPKANPSKPNFTEVKVDFKVKNKDFRQIQTKLFLQSKPNLKLKIKDLQLFRSSGNYKVIAVAK